MSKPSSLYTWADGGSAPVVQPTTSKRSSGFGPKERPPAQFFNAILKAHGEWVGYLDVGAFAGYFAYDGILSPSALTASNNDYNPTSLASASGLRLTTDGSGNGALTGISGGGAGRRLTLVNIHATDSIALKNQSSSSSAANRMILTVTGVTGDLTLPPNGWVTLWYDSVTQRWRVESSNLAVQGVLTLSIPATMAIDTGGNHTHNGSGESWTMAAGATTESVAYPIPLRVGDIITGYTLYCQKTTTGSDTLSADIFNTNGANGTTTSESVSSSNNANNPGFITLSLATSITVTAGKSYWMKVLHSANTAGSNTLYGLEIAYKRPTGLS